MISNKVKNKAGKNACYKTALASLAMSVSMLSNAATVNSPPTADSIINLNETIISKPFNRNEALKILQKLNGKRHHLISSVCISKNGSMIWNYTDKAALTMKEMTIEQLKAYLAKIKDEALYAYNVYQIESEGRSLFSKIEGDEDTIMGLPIKQIKKYLNTL